MDTTTASIGEPAIAALVHRFYGKAERIAESLKLALFYRPDAIRVARPSNPS